MYFEEIKNETLYIALEVINSNHQYNLYENGIAVRTLAEIEKELLNTNTTSAFIKLDDTYIGVIDYLLENPRDHVPWLGLLMIHGDYQGYGFGAKAYGLYELEMQQRGLDRIRLGVLEENIKAQRFWLSMGFIYYITTTTQNGRGIFCYEKKIGE